MKRSIALVTLGLALSFSSVSLASDYISLYTKPVAKSEVKNEIRGGKLERDFTSFYISPKTANTTASLKSERESDDQYVFVFGVKIAR